MSTRTAVLSRGPFEGVEGELVGLPPTLTFGENGGFVYRLDEDTRDAKTATYVYSPELSPAHPLVLDADRQAVREVAAERGIPVAQLLDEARAGKFDKGGLRPLDILLQEAERTGIAPLDLVEQGYDPVTGLYLPEESP